MDYTGYQRRRTILLHAIHPYDELCCERCGGQYDSYTIHHIRPEDGHGVEIGGAQHLYLLEQDFVDNVPLMVVCDACHDVIHEMWRDGS